MSIFKLKTDFTPKGHQKKAIRVLSKGVNESEKHQVLLGVTGSGKTFTMANVIAETGKPTIIMAPNKTLAAQLYNEFKQLFPDNAVEYFVSYYDYYQPEAYIPTSDTYIQKDSSINEMIDKMRHSATRNLLSRKDVIIVASVSCIYGLGAPEDYLALRIEIETGMEISRDKLLKELVAIQYERNDMDFHRGTFRVRGDVVEVFPAYEEEKGIRVEFFGDEIDSLSEFDPLTGKTLRSIKQVTIFPGSHYVTMQNTRKRAVSTITEELKTRIDYFRNENKLLEAQRIDERTNYDLEMIREIGYCNGIENYSRHLTGRKPGESPPTLFDYFPDDFLMFFDESHVSVSQLRAMYRGDRSRKSTLVEFGFRLPSALDNRPLKFEEYVEKVNQVIYVSATPADYELEICNGNIVEQIVRPTGLIDPEITVKPAKNQVDDLYDEIVIRQKRGERVLVTCLTKKMSEDLTEYYTDLGLPVRYLHSEIQTMERMDIINDLREGLFDVLIGINLLREGLDIPEVSLVAILDADKEGFLRSNRSLIQTCGRAARNAKGQVIMYADKITKSMQYTMDETERRKKIQIAYNKKHNITPETISKSITTAFDRYDANKQKVARNRISEKIEDYGAIDNIEDLIESLEKEMKNAAKALEFETAAKLRDKIRDIKKKKK